MTQTWDDIRGSDIIDTRDITDRLDELTTTVANHSDGAHTGDIYDEDCPTCDDTGPAGDEFRALTALVEAYDGSYFEDRFADGVTLIRDDYFEQYAEQLADDIGAIDRDATWPITYIDWTAAAKALQQDYTSIDIDGITYWGR